MVVTGVQAAAADALVQLPLQVWTNDLELESADSEGIVLSWTNLTEAMDVVIGRWLLETVTPRHEASYDDLHLDMLIWPTSTEPLLDTSIDFSGLLGDDLSTGEVEPLTWAPYHGDNPYLAREYRAEGSAWPYYGLERAYTGTPMAWSLAEGEQLNLHFGDSGLTLASAAPSAEDLPDNVVVQEDSLYSITRPVDLEAWSQAAHAEEWSATGGLLPLGVPALSWE